MIITVQKSRVDEIAAQLIKDFQAKGATVSPILAQKMALQIAYDERLQIVADLRAALGSLGDSKQ